ncbi:MAG: hypothetical protein JNJ58_00325 [Chitinophagaceae bacterium]|nr:hypothetical protein [Chitinophagaceae bacterium]
MKPYLQYIVAVFLFGMCFDQAAAQTLTLFAIPPPHKVDWSSPHLLLRSMGRNFFSHKISGCRLRRPLGHVVVMLEKDGDTLLTGMVADRQKDLVNAVVFEKYGLGVLLKMFNGHLEQEQQLKRELARRTQTGKVAFITYHINDSSYHYLRTYVDSFQRLGYDRRYNGNNTPRMGGGSGCSSFGMSFLELIGELKPEFTKACTSSVAIPTALIGGEDRDRKVGLVKVFFSFRWAKAKQAYTRVTLYDPNLIYAWIQKTYEDEKSHPTGLISLLSIEKAKGIRIECEQSSKPAIPMFLK